MINYSQLTLEQRYQIQCLCQQNVTQKQIAFVLGVHPSTISRELARNNSMKLVYSAQLSNSRCKAARSRAPYKLKGDLLKKVIFCLRERHSPEQISGTLALEAGHKVVSHETIYKYIYTNKNTEIEPLTTYLRIRHRKKYKKRGQIQTRGSIVNRVGIEHRPIVVDQNVEVGHWEGDTVIGADHDGVLLTLVERVTKYTIIAKLPSKQASKLSKALIYKMSRCKIPVKTITFDNGKEFADHQAIAKALKVNIYFATPYHSWARAGRPVPFE